MRTRSAGVALWLALATTACGAAGTAGAGPAPGPGSTAELEAIYRARVDSARARFTEADVRFMTGMIGHHAQALEMARLAPTRGASPQVQVLAARIISAQSDEIATMQRWLRDRGQPVPAAQPGADHAAHMPGMVTPDQMRALEQARGSEFDRLFLRLMIQHHAGAVAMVRELFATDGAGQDEEVFKFASDAQVDQATEIARMERMLLAMGGAGGTL